MYNAVHKAQLQKLKNKVKLQALCHHNKSQLFKFCFSLSTLQHRLQSLKLRPHKDFVNCSYSTHLKNNLSFFFLKKNITSSMVIKPRHSMIKHLSHLSVLERCDRIVTSLDVLGNCGGFFNLQIKCTISSSVLFAANCCMPEPYRN